MIGEFEEAMTTGTGLRVQEKGPHLDIFAQGPPGKNGRLPQLLAGLSNTHVEESKEEIGSTTMETVAK